MPWFSTLSTNIGIAAVAGALILLGRFLGLHLDPVAADPDGGLGRGLAVLRSASIRADLAEEQGTWNHDAAALEGSSFYDLPQPLRWFTGNIGVHHLHHLSSRIPFFRLPKVLKTYPELEGVGRLTLTESLRCVRLTLWDEAEKRLISLTRCGHRINEKYSALLTNSPAKQVIVAIGTRCVARTFRRSCGPDP